jgi:hypothetical protein
VQNNAENARKTKVKRGAGRKRLKALRRGRNDENKSARKKKDKKEA